MESYHLYFESAAFEGPITCLRFGPYSDTLAVGDEQGVTTVIARGGPTNPLFKWFRPVPVTALCWHPYNTSIFVGFGDGGIIIYDTTGTQQGNRYNRVTAFTRPINTTAVIEKLEFDIHSGCLLVCAGADVITCYMSDNRSWLCTGKLGNPPNPDNLDRQSRFDPPLPRAAFFTDQGNKIIVSYLLHGIACWDRAQNAIDWTINPRSQIGSACISLDHRFLLVHNLFDGFDCYSLTDHSFVRTHSFDITDNMPIEASFFSDSDTAVFGSSTGTVTIKRLDPESIVADLPHGVGLIQNIAYKKDGGINLIASASVKEGGGALLKVWRGMDLSSIPPLDSNAFYPASLSQNEYTPWYTIIPKKLNRFKRNMTRIMPPPENTKPLLSGRFLSGAIIVLCVALLLGLRHRNNFLLLQDFIGGPMFRATSVILKGDANDATAVEYRQGQSDNIRL